MHRLQTVCFLLCQTLIVTGHVGAAGGGGVQLLGTMKRVVMHDAINLSNEEHEDLTCDMSP